MDLSNGKTLSASLAMLSIAILAVVIPFMTTTKKSVIREKPLVLRTEDEIRLLAGDRDKNGKEDWKDVILNSLSTSTKLQAETVTVSEQERARLNDPDNITASFTKNLYTASAVASKNKSSESEDGVVIANLLSKEIEKLQTKTITVGDVIIAASDTPEAKRRYANTMALLMREADTYNLGTSDQEVLEQYKETKDPTLLTFFSTKEKNLEKIVSKLLITEVPSSAVLYHVELINAANSYALILNAFAKTENDPLRSLIALDSYVDILKRVFIAMDNIRKYVVVEKIPFTSSDPGYIFIK